MHKFAPVLTGTPIEVTGSVRAAEALGQSVHSDQSRKTGRIHFVHRGDENKIGAGRPQHFEVGRLAARIGAKILGRSKLLRVDEDGSDHPRARPLRRFDQRDMPGMERAHRRHQRDTGALGAEFGDPGTEQIELTDGLHAVRAFDKDGAGLLWGPAQAINTAIHQGRARLVDGCKEATCYRVRQ